LLKARLSGLHAGAFALVGAGAFMGGVTRLTIALAVIMIEVSSDVHMLLPVLVAIMTVSSCIAARRVYCGARCASENTFCVRGCGKPCSMRHTNK
jgi:hypothetical protein